MCRSNLLARPSFICSSAGGGRPSIQTKVTCANLVLPRPSRHPQHQLDFVFIIEWREELEGGSHYNFENVNGRDVRIREKGDEFKVGCNPGGRISIVGRTG